MAYSIELKQKALDYLEACGNLNQVATAFGVDRSTIRAWVKKKQSGNLACCSGGYRHSKIDKQQLLEFIQDNETGKPCIIILDNARFHRMKHLQDIINQNTANNTQTQKHIILPLPPYSPDLNPIEKTWATIKKWFRSHLSQFESIEQGLMEYFGVK